jgi:hypothetical protein
MKKFGLFVVLGVLVSSVEAFAYTEISKDRQYIYYKTPFSEMGSHVREAAINVGIKVLQKRIKELAGEIGGDLNRNSAEEYLTLLSRRGDVLEQTLSEVRDYSSLEDNGIDLSQIRPTAFFAFAGGTFSADWGFSAGGSITVGLVVVPTRVRQIEIATGIERRYYVFDTALIGWPVVDLGVGVGGSAGLRIGLGAIWGPLKKASDFTGLLGAVSISGKFGIGLNIKAGVLLTSQGAFQIRNPFFTVAFDQGAEAEFAAHVNASTILPASQVIKMIAGVTPTTPDQAVVGVDDRGREVNPEDGSRVDSSACPATRVSGLPH